MPKPTSSKSQTREKAVFTTRQHELMQSILRELQVSFADEQLLRQAFTHSSYVNEHRMKHVRDNERLEFLGDAVLELAVSNHLFREFPSMTEGDMTKLRAAMVCEASLASLAEELQFGNVVLMGKGEEMTGGRTRPALLADVFESFVGAMYLDQGLSNVEQFLERFVFPKLDEGAFSVTADYKSQLQEFVQKENLGVISYEITDEQGPAHNREFHSAVSLNEARAGTGRGRSKKEAEQRAAQATLEQLQRRE